jgi:hypothetical protein
MRMASTLPRLPIFKAIAEHDPESTVVVHSASRRRFTYGELLSDVAAAKDNLLAQSPSKRIDGERIAFLVENSYDYVGAQLLPTPIQFYSMTDCDCLGCSDIIELSRRAFNCAPSFSCIPGA